MTGNNAGRLRLTVECSVIDATVLWDVAAGRAAHDFAMTLDDVVDTIGPRDDPEVEACMSLLFDCLIRPSGAFDAVTITALHSTSDAVPVPPATVACVSAVASLATMHTTRAA